MTKKMKATFNPNEVVFAVAEIQLKGPGVEVHTLKSQDAEHFPSVSQC